MNVLTEKRTVTVARWIGRILGILVLGSVVILAIGEAKPDRLREMATTIALWTMLGGLVVAWKWEGLGSFLILGGFAAFVILVGGFRISVILLVSPFSWCLIVGLLFAFCWWKDRKTV